MKRHVLAAMTFAVCHSLAFATELTRAEIQAAIEAAPNNWLGDTMRSSDRQYYYGSFARDLQQKYLATFESVPVMQSFLSAALPRRASADILPGQPSSTQSFVRTGLRLLDAFRRGILLFDT